MPPSCSCILPWSLPALPAVGPKPWSARDSGGDTCWPTRLHVLPYALCAGSRQVADPRTRPRVVVSRGERARDNRRLGEGTCACAHELSRPTPEMRLRTALKPQDAHGQPSRLINPSHGIELSASYLSALPERTARPRAQASTHPLQVGVDTDKDMGARIPTYPKKTI